MSEQVWAIAIHGGAGALHKSDYSAENEHMTGVLTTCREMLQAGASARDAVVHAVRELEESGHHIAGRGASPNMDGKWELDAAIMEGETRNAGAVAALRGFRSPIDAAVKVLEESPHILIVGKGASRFLRDKGLRKVKNPSSYYRPSVRASAKPGELQHGTVGAIALDTSGRLAAGTSTGGLLNKVPGRVGDTPLIGAGTWADERVAVSCTGQGEYFIRVAGAADVSARVRYAQMDIGTAAAKVIEDLGLLGGQGGMIAIDRLGRIAAPFNTPCMKRGMADWKGRFEVSFT